MPSSCAKKMRSKYGSSPRWVSADRQCTGTALVTTAMRSPRARIRSRNARTPGFSGTLPAYRSPASSIHSAMISSSDSGRWQNSFVNFAASGKMVCATPS